MTDKDTGLPIGIDALQFLLRTAVRDLKNSANDLENLFDISKSNVRMYIYHYEQIETRAKYVRRLLEEYDED